MSKAQRVCYAASAMLIGILADSSVATSQDGVSDQATAREEFQVESYTEEELLLASAAIADPPSGAEDSVLGTTTGDSVGGDDLCRIAWNMPAM